MVRFTRTGRRALTLAALAAAVARIGGLSELTALAFGAAVLVAVAWLLLRFGSSQLLAQRVVHPRRVESGGTVDVNVTITNPSRFRTPVVVLADVLDGELLAEIRLAPLQPRSDRRARYRFVARHRGIARMGPIQLLSSDPFGVVERESPTSTVSEVIVLPRIHPLADLPPAPGEEPEVGVAHRRVLMMAHEEFASIRDYVAGDDIRRVHWPSTARAGRPMVRHYEQPWQRRTTVVLDTRRSAHTAESFERAVSAAASVIVSCHQRGELVRLLHTDGADTGFIDDGHGVDSALDTLAAVNPSGSGSIGGALRSIAAQSSAGRLVTCVGELDPPDAAAVAASATFVALHVMVSCGRVPPAVPPRAVSVRFVDDDDLTAAWSEAGTALGLVGRNR